MVLWSGAVPQTMEEGLHSPHKELHNLIRSRHHNPLVVEVAGILVLVVGHRSWLEGHRDLQQVWMLVVRRH